MAAKKPELDAEDDSGGVLSGVSSSQVVGSALAAMTAAVAGSLLGVAGTLIGAAVGSVVATIAGTIYTNSLRKSRQLAQAARLTSLATMAKRDVGAGAGAGGTAVLPVPEALDEVGQPGDGGVEDTVDPETAVDAPDDGAEVEADGTDTEAADPDAASKRLISWRGVAAATVASLLLALGGILAYEAIVGHPLGDSGKSGTTFSNVGTTSDDGKDGGGDKDGGTDPSPSSTPSTTDSDPDEPAPTDEVTPPAEEAVPQQPGPTTEPTPEPSTPSTEPAPQPDNLDEDPSLGQPSPAPAADEATPSSFEG
ncbi:hypothetical protein KV100_18130 [Mumia sp. zg.B21]|uniref:hypothetical protein n=1 Tax=unclassified Mumia TaxID=2621872 RepID=UPI001C6E63E7|nr:MULTISPECIES: hypothetical protein [unclassified Mumia]MBW9211574.1 hypothetical protein [Mumia sp. zg.B21]MDD9348690.1 hypothetical protein [Mumia sp.]